MIRRDAHYLVAKRPAHKRHGGLWEFPGGKLLPGETWMEAARRELLEELGVETVAVGTPLAHVSDAGSPYVIAFVPVEVRGEPRALEHEELRWAALDELQELEMAPADAEFVGGLVDAAES